MSKTPIIEDHTERKENLNEWGQGLVTSYKEALAQPKSISDTNAFGQVRSSRHLIHIFRIVNSFKSRPFQVSPIPTCIMMKFYVLCAFVALAAAQPAKPDFWKGTSMDTTIDQLKSDCSQKNDEISCVKFKLLNLVDHILRKDNFKVSETVEVTRNSYPVDEVSARSEGSFLETVQSYLASHDVTFKLPFESSVKVSPRNIDDDELTFNVKFGEGRAVQEARKSKLKKVIIPILVFVLLKAMTLIPLAIGVLGLKAWNALQLSFFSFVVSVGLAIFQLCKKIAADSHAAPISAHGPWEYQAAQYRAFDQAEAVPQETAQDLAYAGYVQN